MSGNNNCKGKLKRNEVKWLKNMLESKSSSSSTTSDSKPQCENLNPAELRTAWNQIVSKFKSAAEQISNELKSQCQESKGSPSSTYVFETLHRCTTTTSQDTPRSSSSKSKTYTVPESSTPTCQLHVGLPSFPHSPIIPAESVEDKKVMRSSVSRGILKVKSKTGEQNFNAELTTERKLLRQREDNDDVYDYQRSTWQTSGLTRSEIEYQKRNEETGIPSIHTEKTSLIKVCVKSKSDIRPENQHRSQPQSVNESIPKKHTRRRDKDGNGSSRYTKLYQDLEHVRRLDYKMRDLMKRLRDADGDGDQYENSGDRKSIKLSSRSGGGITIGEVLKDIDEFLRIFPAKKENEGSEFLEEQIRTHMTKIGHQIRLLEKYNRLILQRASNEQKSTHKGSTKLSPLEYRSQRQRGNYNDRHKEEQLAHEIKSNVPKENPNSEKYSDERKTRFRTRHTKHTGATSPNRGGLGTHRHPQPHADDYDYFQLNHPIVEGSMPAAAATVAYERWTWSYVQPVNIYEPPDFRITSGTDRMLDLDDRIRASTHRRRSRQPHHRASENSESVAVGGNEREQGDAYGKRRSCRTAWDHVRIYDADENENLGCMQQTFTSRSTSITRGGERIRTLEQGQITDGLGLERQRPRGRRSRGNVRQRRDGWTLTDVKAPIPHEERRRRNQGTNPSEEPTRDESVAKRRSKRDGWTLTDIKEPRPEEEERRRRNQGTTATPSYRPKKDKSVSKIKNECDGWTLTEIPSEDKRVLEQGTSTNETRMRDKGVEKMRRKRDGWTLTENPKAREIEIQTVRTITRSQSRSTRAKGKRKISEKEMRERTARLRAYDTVLLEKRRKEEEKARRAANRLLQKTYASKIRSHRKGAGRNIDISTDVSVLGDDDDHDTLLNY